MFTKHHHPTFLELSNDVQDEHDWVIGHLRTIDIPLNISAISVEPVTKLLAIGTSAGSIFIHGAPGVEVKISTPVSVGVKFLNFSSRTQCILCVDDNNQLHIWDLSTFGAPEYLATSRYDQVNSIHVSPSLSHVFLGMQNGEIKTYDLACLRKSPYTIPNMWTLYRQSMLASGIPSFVDHSSQFSPCVDQALHPRDLNQIFVAYEGGVILSNITDRSTLMAYELTLPPGAPGGSGYGAPDILTHRQPPVTCLAIHPAGHFFAVGHADGSIAFWAVDDDSRPLTVFTFDEDNVHLVDSTKLETHLQAGGKDSQTFSLREPIIKMAWSGYTNSSDPRGGETTLTVLGGLDSIRGGDLTVLWFPPFQPPEPPAVDKPLKPGELNPFFRHAMVESLSPIDLVDYEFDGEAQDFLLIPADHPHYGGVYDPYAIACLVATKGNHCVLQTYSFPPSRTISVGMTNSIRNTEVSHSKAGTSPTTSALAAMSLTDDSNQGPPPSPFHSLSLPLQLLGGGAGLTGGQLITLENAQYERIVSVGKTPPSGTLTVSLEGGKAFSDQSHRDEVRLTKYQPRRVLITYNHNHHAMFFDISAQLLVGGPQEPLQRRFPDPLLGLTIDIESVWNELVARGKCSERQSRSIQAVHLAAEALEVATVLETGDLVVHRCNPTPKSLSEDKGDDDITVLHFASPDIATKFIPYFALRGQGQVEACSISDAGFLAVSYSTGGIVIVDMRGPRIIHRTAPDAKGRHRISMSSTHKESGDVANSLTWTVSTLDQDEALRVRLLVSRRSGSLEVVTLLSSGSPVSWAVSGPPLVAQGVSEPIHGGSFVLDSKTGDRRSANGSLLSSSYHAESGTSPTIFVTVGMKGARSYHAITGQRIGKVDWGIRAGSAIFAQIIERMASKALVVVTDKEEALTYSLPRLELITRFKMLPLDQGPVSIDSSGDFVAFSPNILSGTVLKLVYGTFFDIRRAYSCAEIDFAMQPCKVPQPQPISMGPPSIMNTWLNFKQSIGGDQLDNTLGGPNRPLPARRNPNQPAPTATGPGYAATASTAAATVAASAASAQASLYNKLSSALSERGQLLGSLGEGFNSLEQGSRNMANQARTAATKQTAKSWFSF